MVLAGDVGPGVGLGHQRRLEALGSALAESGVPSQIVSTDQPVNAPILVVDSYLHRADDENHFRGDRVIAIDDLVRDLGVDVVVDYCPGASARQHPSAVRVLAGSEYVVIDPDLRTLASRPLTEAVTTILVTAGGSATTTVGAQLAVDLARTSPRDTKVQLAVGSWTEHGCQAGVEPVRAVNGLGTFLAQADLVVTAAGVTMFEALTLGRPTIAFVLADNQRRQADAVARLGGIVLREPNEVVAEATSLIGDYARRTAMGLAGSRLIDGGGAVRVAKVILAAR